MRFGAAFWIQRTTWPELRDACLAAERAGWDSLWVDDHLLADEGDPSDAKLEGWATISALADGDPARPPGPPRRRQHVPRSGADREARDHGRPPVGRTVRPRPRWRLVRARARRVRARLRVGLRRTARPSRRVGRAHPAAARRGAGQPRRTLLRDARRRVRAAADPGTAADPHRRLRARPRRCAPRPATPTCGTALAHPSGSRRSATSCAIAAPRSAARSTRSNGPSPSTP